MNQIVASTNKAHRILKKAQLAKSKKRVLTIEFRNVLVLRRKLMVLVDDRFDSNALVDI